MIVPGSVKICSLRRPEHAEMVVRAGADAFGLIFDERAWRHVTPEQGRIISVEVRRLAEGQSPRAVGIFVTSDTDTINRVAEEVGLDFVQVHIHGDPIAWGEIERPVIPVLRPDANATAESVRQTTAGIQAQTGTIAAFQIDAFKVGSFGGAGVLGNWDVAREIAMDYPVILAGGLTPENVAAAIESVRPVMVDVSSGVETDKEKDPGKIRAFVRNAREAFAAVPKRAPEATSGVIR